MKQLYSKTLLCLLAFFLFFAGSVNAQQIITQATYAFNRATAGPNAWVWNPLISSGSDDVASAVTDIGFTFWFAGTPYTQFSVNSNGLMTLGSTQISGSDNTNDMASGTTVPKIAPYWDDLATGTTGSVGYFLQGTAPNRTLYINWNVTVPKNTLGAANTILQVKLLEATNQIILNHGPVPINAGAYTIGIGKSGTDYASVVATLSAATCVFYPTVSDNDNTNAINQCSYNFTPDYFAPPITYTQLPSIPGTANRILTATIADYQTGVPLSGSLVPRIYFKKGADGIYFSTPGVYASGTLTNAVFTFTINHALLGGVTGGDQIYYYIIAQDQSASGEPNIASNPAGVVATDVNTIITHPSAPAMYTIGSDFSGVKTVGPGGDYTSLTLLGGLFDQINAGQLTGNLTVNITSDLTAETGLKALNAWVNGPGGPFTVTINPVGNRIVSGITVNGGNGGVITLNGASGVTIDGLNDGTNSLTFIQTGQYYVGSMIDIKGASNNTITRITVKGFGASNYGITLTNSISPFRPSSNNTISYCNITTNDPIPNAGNGIGLIDWTGATSIGNLNVIDHNTISNFIYTEINVSGKYSNTVISNNEIYNTVGTAQANTFKAINLGAGISGTTNVFNNKIHDLKPSGTFAGSNVTAILSNGPAGTTTNIYNNVIYLDPASTDLQQTWYGIQTLNPGAVNIYYNSIYIGGTNVTAGSSYGLYRGGTGTTNILNNAVFNARSNSSGTGKHYGIYITGTTGLTSNYNDIFVNGSGGYFGFSTSDRLTLAAWQTTGKDANSFSGDPGFTSVTDLQPDITNPNSVNLNDHGTPIAIYGTDILGNTRSTSLPDIGAYEFTIPPPTAFAVTGTGFYYPGGSGLPVGLADSETGVTYTLFIDDVAQVPTIPGTGEAISFGNQLFGTYTVSGTSVNGTTLMTGNAIIADATSLPNVALNKPATSDGAITAGNEPSKANDDIGTNSSYWSGPRYPNWWKVDLGGTYDLSAIVIRNYVGNDRYYKYNIEASLDDQSYTQIAEKTNTNVATDAGDGYTVSVTARYLRVNMTYHSRNVAVHISDFRAYGTANASFHVITASAGTGGSISPSGAVAVANGTDQAFTITPDFGYQIADVLVGGGSVGAVASYQFTNVTASHTISATFTVLENVALNKPATSDGAITAGLEPSKANDDIGTNSSYWSGPHYPNWWRVDLGGTYDLSAIVIRNYVGNDRYYQYNIEASLDDQSYTQIAEKTNTNVATDAGDGYTVSVTARYLRVNMTYHSRNVAVHISDFRAYGTLQSGAKGSNPSGNATNSKVSNPTDSLINQEIKTEEYYMGNIKLNVYPNPFRDRFTLRIDSPNEEMFEVSVISLLGGLIHLKTEIPANTDNTFNLQLANGIYILKVNHKGIVMTQRIVKY